MTKIITLIFLLIAPLSADQVYLGRTEIERAKPPKKHLYTYTPADLLDAKKIEDNLVTVKKAIQTAEKVLTKNKLKLDEYVFTRAEIKKVTLNKADSEIFWVWVVYFREFKGDITLGVPPEISVTLLGSGELPISKIVTKK